MCAACPTPRLNLKFELRPSWNNSHDTFPTGTAQDKTTQQADIHAPAGFEPATPARKRPQTYGLDRAAIGRAFTMKIKPKIFGWEGARQAWAKMGIQQNVELVLICTIPAFSWGD